MLYCIITEIHVLGSSLIGRLANSFPSSRGARGIPYYLNVEGIPGLGLAGVQSMVDKHLKEDGYGFVVIHAGANDIGNLKEHVWVAELRCILTYIRAKYPHYQPVWSDMLPRNKWRHGPVQDEHENMILQENARKRLQRRARLLFWENGGTVVHHPSLQKDFSLLCPLDGVHLTPQGQADFWGDFLNFIHNI